MLNNIKNYKLFDLALLSIIALVSEIMGSKLLDIFPGAGFHLSFSILVALIAMIRWDKAGAIVYIIAGLPMIFLGAGTYLENIMLYPLANLFIIFTALLFKLINRDKLRSNNFYILLYVLIAYISVGIGKGITLFLMSGVFLESVFYYLMGQLFNMIMVFIILLLLKEKDGLLEDMEEYFIKDK